MTIAKFIKLFALLIQIPVLIAASNSKKATIKNIRFKKFKKRSFIILKKVFNFKCIGAFPVFNKIYNFYIGIYHKHKIGMFEYRFSSLFGSFNTTVLMINLDKPLPKFHLRPKNINYYLLGWFFRRKKVFVDFEQNYILLANDCDKIKVAQLFNDEVMNYLSTQSYLWIESDGRNLMVFNEKVYLFDGSNLEKMLVQTVFFKQNLGNQKIIDNDEKLKNQLYLVLDRERNRSEGKSGLKQNTSLFEEK